MQPGGQPNRFIAEYFLMLARNKVVQTAHFSSDDKAKGAMTEFGLTDEQQALVLSRDTDAVNARIEAEIRSASTEHDIIDITVPWDVNFGHIHALPPIEGEPS